MFRAEHASWPVPAARASPEQAFPRGGSSVSPPIPPSPFGDKTLESAATMDDGVSRGPGRGESMIRNGLLAVVAFTLALPAAMGQSWAEKLFKEGTSHDFQSIPRGAQLYHKFKMTNIYAVPLEIVNIRTSCSCATVAPSAKLLEPRQEGAIEITLDSRRFTGPKTVSVFVTVGPQYTSTAELRLSFNSRGDVVLNPGEVNFGVVPVGQASSQTIEVEYAGTLDWRVSEVAKGSAPVDASFEEMYRRPGQVGYRVKVNLRTDAPAGSHKWELFLKTNDPAGQLVPVLVEAAIQAPLTVLPETLKLADARVGIETTCKAIVKGSKPFRILAVEGLGDGITTATVLPSSPAAVHTVLFKCRPLKPGELRLTVRIKTDLQDAPVTLTIEGNAAP